MKKLLIVAALCVSAVSFAQDSNDVKVDVRGGVVLPGTGDLSGTFWGAGVDATFAKSFLQNSQTFLSIDWIAKTTKTTRNQMFPIMINQRFELAPMSTTNSNRTYGFVGVGAAILDFGNSSTVLAGRLGLGMDFSPNIFGEVTYVLTARGKSHHKTGNNFGFYVGFRL